MVEFRIPYKVTGNEGLNKLYAGGHWAIRKKKADKWHNLVHESLVTQVPKRIFDVPVIIDIAYNSRLDIDNHGYLSKLIVDGMKGYLIHEDNRKHVTGLIQRFHNEGEQIIIRVMEAEQMINIKLDNKLSITSDSNQYILREMKEGTKDGEKIEIYEAIGYFGTLSGALKEYIRKCLRES